MKKKKMLMEAGTDLIYKGKMHPGRVVALILASLVFLALGFMNIVAIAFLFIVFSAVLEKPMRELIPLDAREYVKYEYAERFLYSSYWSLIYVISCFVYQMIGKYTSYNESMVSMVLTASFLFLYGMTTRIEYKKIQGKRKIYLPKVIDRVAFVAIFYEFCIQGQMRYPTFFLFEWTRGLHGIGNLILLTVMNVVLLLVAIVQYPMLIVVREK